MADNEVRSMNRCKLDFAVACLFLLGACGSTAEVPQTEQVSVRAESWLQGTADERFNTVTKHLRGLDMAMVEIGYRYQELYRAGSAGNWPYATYQANKIRQSLANALERRPKRAASTDEYFFPVLDVMNDVLSRQDSEQFTSSFTALTNSCNACHVAEGVPSFVVVPPEYRTSPIE